MAPSIASLLSHKILTGSTGSTFNDVAERIKHSGETAARAIAEFRRMRSSPPGRGGLWYLASEVAETPGLSIAGSRRGRFFRSSRSDGSRSSDGHRSAYPRH